MQEVDLIPGGQHSSDWWYYLKKSFKIYPGISDYICAEFLDEYYSDQQARLTLFGRFRNLLFYPGFQIWVVFRARQVGVKYGLDKDWVRMASEISRERFLDPNDMVWFRITQSEHAEKLLRRFEYAAINKLINPRNWRKDCILGNKIAFHNHCVHHNIPHPQIIATVHKGEVKIFEKPKGKTLAVKPSGSEGGRGFRLINFDQSVDDWRGELGRNLSQITDNRNCGWVVQEKLVNHPDLKPLAQSALITARLVTMINERGEPELIASVLRFPSDPEITVDNLKGGALMAKINMDTETLETACLGRGARDIETHPVNDVAIKGYEIPYTKEAKELVIAAHNTAFSDYTLIGWDVVITQDGPIILEGNGKPGIDITQRGMWANAGETRFGELIAYHIHQKLKDNL